MIVNKKKLAEIFGCDVRTITTWQSQGLAIESGGGKGVELMFDTARAIKWFTEREASIENEKLRREVDDLRAAAETDLEPGTIDFERYRLTKAQADAQELKNARERATVVDTQFCLFVLGKVASEIAGILDGIPLSWQRQFPDAGPQQVEHLKVLTSRGSNRCAEVGERLPDWLNEFIEISKE